MENWFKQEEGETETENPFDIDVMKETIEEEGDENKKDEEEKRNKNGLEVSSDEDDGQDEDKPDESQVSSLKGFIQI